jgi:putative protease
MGIESLKIEGRTKSHYYVARTAQVYRTAIDHAHAGKPFDMHLMSELDALANRGYTEGFYRRHVPAEYQNYETGNSTNTNQQYVAELTDCDPGNGKIQVDVKNRFKVGDYLELMTPKGNFGFNLEHMESTRGETMDVAPGSGWTVNINLPEELPFSLDSGHCLLIRHNQ